MSRQSRNDESITTTNGVVGPLSGQAIVVVIAGITATWMAADSTGFLGHSLRHALTCIFLAVAGISAWPWPNRTGKKWVILTVGAGLTLALLASSFPTVNILAVALFLAILAYIHEGLKSRAILLSALAAMVLAVFRLACQSTAIVWQLANMLGWSMGKLAGGLTGQPLTIGATFGGIDFLVLMIALYIGWLYSIAPPWRRVAIYAGIAIALAHLTYLVALAYSDKLAALLPEPFYVPETEISRVGVWAWQNALRALLPWNLPLAAMVLHGLVAAGMFRWTAWLPVAEPKKQAFVSKSGKDEVIDLQTLISDIQFQFGPVFLAVLIAILATLSLSNPDLKGKNIVAYEKGNFSWLRPEHDNSIKGAYGMLPVFVESLGGRLLKSPALAEADLVKADVLILLHPNTPFTAEQLKRIENYVRRGGSLLLGAENYIQEGNLKSRFNDVLSFTAMNVCYDTVIPLSGNWEQSFQPFCHPAVLGLDDLRDRFGSERGASIRLGWPAWPILVGRWGWSTPGSDAVTQKSIEYQEGQPLGDIVLAAQQDLGQGRIVVLGDMACLNNERLSCSWEFIGRLLGYLAHGSSSPQTLWRQILALAAMGAFIGLLAIKADAARIAVSSLVFAVALISCAWSSAHNGRVLPDGRVQIPNNLAYIEASHLEAFSDDLGSDFGIAEFTRVLMRNGFLPLRLPDLTAERLERAGLLVSMAPVRQFSAEERDALQRFVEEGGVLLFLVGAEQSRPLAALLEEFQLQVSPSPVRPDEKIREPNPLGAFRQIFGEAANSQNFVTFYAAWPLRIENENARTFIYWADKDREEPVVAGVQVGRGTLAVIADTYFAINQNLEAKTEESFDNVKFWRWFLPQITGREPWNPPAETIPEQGPAEKDTEPQVLP